MASHSLQGWELAVPQKEMDPLVFANQLPSFDSCGYLDWHNEIPIQESYADQYDLSLMDSFQTDTSMGIKQSPSLTQEDSLCNCGNDFGVWNELGPSFEPGIDGQLLLCNGETGGIDLREVRKVKRCREEKIGNGVSKGITREKISQYFYMPITKAAKELNVGLTLLKKRCRALGIRRWPHRKLMSLQTLIKNVQELKKVGGEENETKLRAAIETLEKQRKLLEEMPDMELENNTKRLRQACFKASYKKRKLISMMEQDRQLTSSTGGGDGSFHVSCAYEVGIQEDEEDEEIKSLLGQSDSLFSNNYLMF